MELAKRLRSRESYDPSQGSEEDKKMDIDLVHKKDEYKNHIKNILKVCIRYFIKGFIFLYIGFHGLFVDTQ